MHRLLVLLAACSSAATVIHRAGDPLPQVRDPLVLTQSSLRNPCFGGSAPIVATEMWNALEVYADLRDREVTVVPPPARYGSCTVNRMDVRSASGALVATLGCGVLILAPGIRDALGLEVGQRGHEVLARRGAVPLSCVQDGPAKVRCQFQRADGGGLEPFWYAVGGRLDDEPRVVTGTVVTGDVARSFFETRPLVEIVQSVRCR